MNMIETKIAKALKRAINEYIEKKRNMLLLEMSNISSSKTGVPFIVWVQTCLPGNHGKHYTPRVKFEINGILYPMSIEAEPRFLGKVKREKLPISSKEYNAMTTWIVENQESLLQLWNGQITTDVFLDNIQKNGVFDDIIQSDGQKPTYESIRRRLANRITESVIRKLRR